MLARDRHRDLHQGAAGGRSYLETATQIAHTLSHAGQADTHTGAVAVEASQFVLGNSYAAVLYFEGDNVGRAQRANLACRSAGVTVYVHQRFLQHPEQNQLEILRQTANVPRSRETDRHIASAGEVLDIPLRGRNKARVFD